MAAKRPGEAGVRRQERGRRRMQEILDAAEAVIAETGYEDATTNAIAARAGVSPGSLYQFFRNKDEILEALVQVFTERSRDFWHTRLDADTALLPLDELLDRIVHAMAVFKDERPAYWVLFHGSPTSARLARASEELHAGVAARLRTVFLWRVPGLPEERLDLLAKVSIATATGVFPLVMSAEGEQRGRVLAELKGMLLSYLGPVVGFGAVPRPVPTPAPPVA
jgi:AcrR family transcriptional regulator